MSNFAWENELHHTGKREPPDRAPFTTDALRDKIKRLEKRIDLAAERERELVAALKDISSTCSNAVPMNRLK